MDIFVVVVVVQLEENQFNLFENFMKNKIYKKDMIFEIHSRIPQL